MFLLLVTLVIWAYFRNWKMSLAALVALLHDLILTIGIYALVGFTVTPATVIGVLTILGYSLYDTVVVFDKVRENVRDLTSSATRTYSEAANLALNQVLVRSINTTIIGVLPVAALLFAGAVILGEGPLKDLALALFVGMMAGAYSSIFIATPLLAQLKEREPDMKRLAKRVAARRAKEAGRGSSRGGDRPDRRLRSRGPTPSRRFHLGGRARGRVRRARAGRVRPQPEPAADQRRTQRSTELAAEAARTRVTVSSAAPLVPLRPLGDGAAKRPQPQHKPRSQRKEVMSRLADLIRDVPDFPEPGVVFRDITPLIGSAGGLAAAVDALLEISPADVDAVLGIEARGFIFAAPVALALGVGLVPVRKPAKLPRETVSVTLRPRVRHRDAGHPR